MIALLVSAGLVKWYNGGFPNRGREFDSPIPHKTQDPGAKAFGSLCFIEVIENRKAEAAKPILKTKSWPSQGRSHTIFLCKLNILM